jgi:hypothetical protein
MSKLLLNLRNVPDDEADDVRALLDAHGIGFYETPPSGWGLFAGGIFVAANADIAEARRLMAEYQGERSARARAEYAEAKREGTAETFRTVLREQPLRVVLTILAIACLLGLVALPVLLLRG